MKNIIREQKEKRENGGSIKIKDSSGTPIDLANIANYYGHELTYNNQTFQLYFVDQSGKYSNNEGRI